MIRRPRRQISETFFMGALLAVVGGFLDAYTYLLRGGVFANAQTGNIVLLALDLARLEWSKAARYLLPIFAFAAGVMVSEAIRRRFRKAPRVHWRQIVVAAEIAVLFAGAFLPQGRADWAANAGISFICALQVESFRKINGSTFATTMCTGNLRSATEMLYHYLATGDRGARGKSFKYYGIICFFILGAMLGYWLSGRFGLPAVFFCCALLAVALMVMFIPTEQEGGTPEQTAAPDELV